MCGIVLCYNVANSIDIATKIIVAQESRGTDSTGVAFITNKGIKVVKKALTPTQFSNALKVKSKSKFCLGHNRNATTNVSEKDKDREAHPFVSEGKNFAICHNGHIMYHESLRKYLQLFGHAFTTGGVDSEVLVHFLEELLAKFPRDQAMSRFFHIAEGENILVLFSDKEVYGFPGNTEFKVARGSDSVVITSSFDGLKPYLESVKENIEGLYPSTTGNNQMIKIFMDTDKKIHIKLFGDWKERVFKYDKFTINGIVMCDFCKEMKETEKFEVEGRDYDRCIKCYKEGKVEPKSFYRSVQRRVPERLDNSVDAKGKCETCNKFISSKELFYCTTCKKLLCKECYYEYSTHKCPFDFRGNKKPNVLLG